MRDSVDELLFSLDLHLLDNEGVWSVLRSLAAALHRWTPAVEQVSYRGQRSRLCMMYREKRRLQLMVAMVMV